MPRASLVQFFSTRLHDGMGVMRDRICRNSPMKIRLPEPKLPGYARGCYLGPKFSCVGWTITKISRLDSVASRFRASPKSR